MIRYQLNQMYLRIALWLLKRVKFESQTNRNLLSIRRFKVKRLMGCK